MEERIAHVLRRDIENFFEFLPSLKFAELDLRVDSLVVNRIELVVFNQRRVEADIFLPFIKKVFPIVEGYDLVRHYLFSSGLGEKNFLIAANRYDDSAKEMPGQMTKKPPKYWVSCDEAWNYSRS